MPLHVYSIDFDGCMLYDHTSTDQILNDKRHHPFFWRLIDEARTGDEVIICVGSNRQDEYYDKTMSAAGNKGGKYGKYFEAAPSAFSVLHDMADLVKYYAGDEARVSFDGILGADIYQNREIGSSFAGYWARADWIRQGIGSPNLAGYPPVETALDHSKIATLYSQMHHFAKAHPGEEIVFTFYDDNHEVLYALLNFYTSHPELIPSNVTLKLEQSTSLLFDVSKEELFQPEVDEVQGQGKIDCQFPLTCRKMIGKIGRKLFDEKCDPNEAISSYFLGLFRFYLFQNVDTMYQAFSELDIHELRDPKRLFDPADLVKPVVDILKPRFLRGIYQFLTTYPDKKKGYFNQRSANRAIALELREAVKALNQDSSMEDIAATLNRCQDKIKPASFSCIFTSSSGAALEQLLQSMREAVEAQLSLEVQAQSVA